MSLNRVKVKASITMNKKKIFFIMISIVVLASFLYGFLGASQQGNLWSYQEISQNGRTPSGIKENVSEDILIFKDFFSNPNFDKYVNYKLDPHFFTDKDQAYINERAYLAFNQALLKTFTEKKRSSYDFSTLFRKNLAEETISEFLKTLYIFKIFDGNFQFDLKVLPIFQRNINFDQELSTNQLISEAQKGKLFKLLNEIKTDNNLFQTPFPKDGSTIQPLGGVISLNIEVLDLSWNPLNPIPNPSENAVKGHLRYRRYFRINDKNTFKLDIQNFPNFEFSYNKLKEVNKSLSPIITVDIYKEFNLKNLNPEKSYLEIFLGSLNEETLSKKSRWFKKKNSSFLKTGEYFIAGNFKFEDELHPFEIQIHSLVFDFKKGKFDFDKSKIDIKLKKGILGRLAKGKVIHNLRQNLFEDHALDLTHALYFKRYHSYFTE